MRLEIADMLFGPSDPFAFPICLFACNSHTFDSCLNQICISKYLTQNKYLIGLERSFGQQIVAIYTDRYIQDPPSAGNDTLVEKLFVARGSNKCILDL
jgi:hypothetical protein